MNQQQRSQLLESQLRAFTEGSIENINEQWVFFDDETEEALLLDDYIHQEIEVYRHNRWKKGLLLKEGKIQTGASLIDLTNNDPVRIRKQLVYSLERLLEELNEDAFLHFITTLNSLQFSIYDCIYCYNHLTFLAQSEGKSGVNFIMFDNQEEIANVQHHFDYFDQQNDRFEFTLSSGRRTLIERIS
ncbi:DUF2777 domain-containing protein [Mesobacillus harenae]|uniref:DUF2777 domain-containing protein n=1 Tax=Mesobacillus harenae TaxID=2213203 RepID=UPI001580551A|nr:DUF2777 domain-containing protein [Mesobacillus harenae]